MKTEIKVGIFVLLGLISLFFLTFQIKSLETIKHKGYTLYAIVADASGITKKSKVKLRGVDIGIVDKMNLSSKGVKLTLIIKKDVKIPVGSKVTIAQDNMLGGKFLKIIPSDSFEYYSPGDTIDSYLKTASLDEIMNNVNLAVNDIRNVIKKVNSALDKNKIKEVMNNLKEASVKLNSILAKTDAKLPEILKNANELLVEYKEAGKKLPKVFDNANKLINSYKEAGDSLKSKLPEILKRVNHLAEVLDKKTPELINEYVKVGKNANEVLEKNKEKISLALTKAGEFFGNGSESFKKIDQFLSNAQKSQIMVDINSYFLSKDSDFVTNANIAYLPNPTKYYILGFTSRKDYSNKKNPDDDSSKTYLNAQIGKRYDNFLIRGGIIESTGGVGVDYFADKDRVKLSAEIYDFNSENDVRGDNPHMNFKARYLYLKHLEFLAGVDNILNSEARSFFFGIGVKFKDNDLKTIISGGATSFLK